MNVSRYSDPVAAAEACGQRVLDLLAKTIAARKRATLAVSGGTSPKPMFELFAKSGFPWEQVHVFWVDERCVPPSDSQSNFRLANETWLAPAKVPSGNIHRVPTEREPHEAAREYAEHVRTFFNLQPGELPQFEVIHRGVGPDAHTASLFPGEPLIEDHKELAAAVWVEKMHQWRVTLLPGVLEAARNTVVLATGSDKAAALNAVLSGPYDPMKWPAQIATRDGSGAPLSDTMWFLDQAASP
ncbi:MAG: 6-phosphogluconolactonase [Acidobacteriia bacterium]|nr:6-phosphogluconolactonase [Terriglobia bacterium]